MVSKLEKSKQKQFFTLVALLSALVTTIFAMLVMDAVKTQVIVGLPKVKVIPADLGSVAVQPDSQELSIEELRSKPRIEHGSDSSLSYLYLYLPCYDELNEDQLAYWERSYLWTPSGFELTPAGLVRTADDRYILLQDFRQTVQEELSRRVTDPEQGILIEASYIDQPSRLDWLYKPVCDTLFKSSRYIHSLAGAIAYFSLTPGLAILISAAIGYNSGLKKRQKEELASQS